MFSIAKHILIVIELSRFFCGRTLSHFAFSLWFRRLPGKLANEAAATDTVERSQLYGPLKVCVAGHFSRPERLTFP